MSAAFSEPLELPVTTTLMLRAIADIARHHGEDLSTLEARLACVEVFALGAPVPQRRQGQRAHFGYYASRALLGRFTADASAILVERGVASRGGSHHRVERRTIVVAGWPSGSEPKGLILIRPPTGC